MARLGWARGGRDQPWKVAAELTMTRLVDFLLREPPRAG
jgi:hypothetical protein